MTNSNNNLNIMFWNSRGLRNKFTELTDYIQLESLDIIGISETFLDDNISLAHISNYEIVRVDKSNHSGGLLLIIKDSITYSIIDLPSTQLFECMAIKISSPRPFIIILVYCHGSTSDVNSNFYSELLSLCNQRLPVFIMGDFNAKHRAWNCSRSNRAGTILRDFIDRTRYYLSYPLDPTYNPISNRMTPSTIDLLVTDGGILSSDLEVVQKFTSDHYPVRFDIFCDHVPSARINNDFFNFSQANWSEFRNEMSRLIEPLYSEYTQFENLDNDTIDQLIDKLTSSALAAQELAIPKYSNSRSDFVVTPKLRALITVRNFYRSRFTRSRHPVDKYKFNEFKYLVNNEIKNNKENRLTKIMLDCNHNNNNIYKVVKTKRHINIPPLKIPSTGQRLTSRKDKAEELAKTFVVNHSNSLHDHLPTHTSKVNREVNRFLRNNNTTDCPTFELNDITDLIRDSKGGKASGLDNINIKIVKNFPIIAIQFLMLIFNACSQNCYFPKQWKIAKTIAILKPGKDKSLSQSYRPIALLSCFSKLFEKLILCQLRINLAVQNPLPNFQFGFRPFHSTVHALKRLTMYIKKALKDGKITGVIYLDIQKAFDLVWHYGLLWKLIRMGCSPWLVRVIASFLEDREFQVHVGNEHSTRHRISYGVPQGSVLSPNLYSLFIHDIPNLEDCLISLYADDTGVSASSRFIKGLVNRLRRGAMTLIRYYKRWKIQINTEKTAVVFHSRRRTKQLAPSSVIIDGRSVPVSNNVKYLGVTLDNTLTYKNHIESAIQKANNRGRMLYTYLRRHSFASKKLKIKLYKTYIRPILSYASPVISEASHSNRNKIQICQNKFLRLALCKNRYERISDLHGPKMETIDEFFGRLDSKFKAKCEISENPEIAGIFVNST